MATPNRHLALAGLRIEPSRLRADIEAVNALGRSSGRPGIDRISFSDADMAGRRWLAGRLRDAGLEARIDAVGNVLGRWPVGTGKAVLVGSHLDTVPDGGPFDGTLGVCAALEAVRAIRAAAIEPVRPIMVVCTADEEGRFGGMLGSEALCGLLAPGWIDRATADDGTHLRDAMERQGLAPAAADDAALDPEAVAVFLELHIEQGPILAEAGLPIGVVTGVSGCFNWTVTLTGVANHSGTTPMDRRQDAMRGLAAFVHGLDAVIAAAGGPETRLTVGRVALEPNFPHSIAGTATFSLIGRDPDPASMRRVAAACRAALAEVARTQ
ncbi:MAG: hydantoinase/carbamoylase family amidase, partial [Pseudomonadota bacterium]